MSLVRCPACGFNVSDEDGICFICGSKLSTAESTIPKAADADVLAVQNEQGEQMPEDISSVFGELSHEVVQAVFDKEDDI